MTLSEKQRKFTRLIGKLIEFAFDTLGYELTFGDCYRDPKYPYGHPNSVHRKRLAVDFNLFINGEYISDGSLHEPLGKYWESLDPLCRWGGRFNDGNHYSMEHEGIK